MKEGYKKTEVGVIPEDWEVKKLKDISENIFVGIATSTTEYYADNGTILIRNQNIKEDRLDTTELLRITDEFSDSNKNKKLIYGDILTVRTGYPGVSCVVPKEFEGSQTFTTLITRPNQEIVNPFYLSRYFNSEIGKKIFNSGKAGGAQQNLSVKFLEDISVILPPIKEQEKIAEILSSVDCQIDDTEKLIEKCRVLKKGLMQSLLTKGIGHTEFKKTEVGEIPVSWEVKKLGDIVNSERKITYGIVQPGEYDENGVYLIKAGDYSNGWAEVDTLFKVSNEIENKYSRSRLKENDILFTIVGSVGNVALVPEHLEGANLTQQTARISINKNIGDSIYYYYLVQGNLFKMNTNKFLKTGVQPSINLSDLEIFKVPVPPVEEQKKIAKILSSVDRNIKEYDNKKQRLEELKKGLMQQLLTGKIRTI